MTDRESRKNIRTYFEGAGFENLRLAYSDEPCDRFRTSIRRGHSQVVETVLSWAASPERTEPQTVLDAGCGTGSLAVPLALAGAQVHAVDFSAKMVAAAEARALRAGVLPHRLKFSVGDLSSVEGMYDTVVCVDVFARYSTEDSVAILKQLAALARSRLIFTFTPKKVLDPALLVIARIVAKRRQAPPLHTHRTDVITGALGAIGWMILREQEISAGRRSYFCRLVQASPDPDSAGRGS